MDSRRHHKSCCAEWCRNSRHTGIKFFRIPVDERSRAWLQYARRQDLVHLPPRQIYNSYCLCSAHFTSRDYADPGQTRLLKCAVPTVSIFGDGQTHVESPGSPRPANTTAMPAHSADEEVQQTEPSCSNPAGRQHKPSRCSPRTARKMKNLEKEDIAAGPVHAAVPGLHWESGKPAETSPELRCEPGHVAHKSVHVRLLTCHEASQTDEKKILSTSGSQTEPQTVSSGSLDFVSLEQSSALASVQDRLHSCRKKEGPFSCVRCNASFVMKSRLVKHMLIHTGQGLFPCVHCNASFYQKDHLVSHMCVHTEQRPFSCVHCNASFPKKGNLVIHMRTHTGERPFSCVHCNASYIMKCQLVRHMAIHPGVCPFICIHCNASFSKKHYLVSHLRMHTGE
ncbi:uncharacterized protein LOC119167536 [Rhipicephalus microplus]|uniref:uncharacterized protein LOC119167536 n=1 Tax=Rhipicephalus microplus TaxID=6941 RepID=UPI003F6BB128